MKSVNQFFPLVAEVLKVPQELVEDVIDDYFQSLRDELQKPSKPVIKIDELGRFEPKPFIMKKHLQVLLKKLREDPTEEDKESFRFWWKVRQDALKYYIQKRQK